MPDIAALSELKDALVQIEPEDFSRYITLLNLLKNSDYGWNPKNANDRIVIFTERIETMHFLTDNLQKDLKLSGKAVDIMLSA